VPIERTDVHEGDGWIHLVMEKVRRSSLPPAKCE
jgi:hypothetical protein